METRKAIERLNEAKNWLFERKKKNNKLDQSKDKEKRENTQILKSEIK